MAADNSLLVDCNVWFGQVDTEFPVSRFFFFDLRQGNHHKSFFLGWADISTVAATCTIQRGKLHSVLVTSNVFASCILSDIGSRSVFKLLFCCQERTDTSVWANHRALVTHNAVVRNPVWNVHSDTAFFELGGASGNESSWIEFRNRKLVAL